MADAEWTLATLKQHFDALRAEDKKALQTALDAAEKAVLKAEIAGDKRAEASNEIRGAMIDAQSHFADKTETDRRLKALEDARIAVANRSLGISQLWLTAGAVAAAVATILTVIFSFNT